MQQVFAVILTVLVHASAMAQVPAPGGYGPYQAAGCSTIAADHAKYTAAVEAIGATHRGSVVAAAQSCDTNDTEYDPDDDEFSCSDVIGNCPLLAAASIEDLRTEKNETESARKELEDDVEEKQEEQNELKSEAAKLAKDYAEQENDLMSDIATEEREYKEDLQEKDREALAQVQEIQENIRKLADENRKIVLQANRAMAELQAAKLNAKKTCRDQARADYAATLKQLDEQMKARGGKVAGGFEGIANAENYRKFLVAKIKNPEPSEQFTLCYSVGDAVETDLQQRNMGGALTMNEFASQIEENNKQRDQLAQQLQQQQQLAQQQKLEGYQEHLKAIQVIQKKILTNRQNFERESRALSQKMATLEAALSRKQTELGKAIRKASNAEDRYNCLTRNRVAKSASEVENTRRAYAIVRANTVRTSCRGVNPSIPGCEVCSGYGAVAPTELGTQYQSPAPSSTPRRNTTIGTGAQ